jgi:hypothetical protein
LKHEGKPRRRITVTPSINDISTDQLRKRVVVRERRYSARPHPTLVYS